MRAAEAAASRPARRSEIAAESTVSSRSSSASAATLGRPGGDLSRLELGDCLHAVLGLIDAWSEPAASRPR